ncbi:MAG: hypothetical protein ACKVVT_10075 [Dehalococcoidia bacterium]
MRLLYLGSSNETKGDLPADVRRAHLNARALEEAAQAPVELRIKYLWPNAVLPDVVDRWTEEFEPDVVAVQWSAWWCESLVIRRKVAPRLGPLAPAADRVWRRLSRSERVSHTGVYRAANRLALKSLGGVSPFRLADVMPVVETTLRRLVRREELAVSVTAAPFTSHSGPGATRHAWAIDRRTASYALLRPVCERLHIPYSLPDLSADAFDPKWRLGDGVHLNEAGHRRCSEVEAPVIIEAWRRAQGR